MLKKFTPILVLVGAIAIISLALIGFSKLNNPVSEKVDQALGGSYTLSELDLAGSSKIASTTEANATIYLTKFISIPATSTFANGTTTSPNQVNEAGTIIQAFGTEGIEKGNLCMQGIGGTATSTLYARQMGSTDGTNFYDVGSSTDSLVSTTTIGLTSKSLAVDFGVATSTGKCWIIDTLGYKMTRFILWSEHVDAEENDYVKAHIWWSPIDIRQD